MNFFLDVDRVVSENIFAFSLLFFFFGSFLIFMGFEIVLNNAVENDIPYPGGHIFSAGDALLLFSVDQISQAGPTKSMITGLNTDWNIHDFITKSTGYLLFD
jgi:hypothetical protein